MKVLELRKSYQLKSIIESLSKYIEENGYTNDYYNLYTEKENYKLTSELTCFLEEGPEITDDDEEIYPQFVKEKSLNLIYRGERFEDVIMNVLHQKKDATIEDYIIALDYYSKYDTFKDF